MERISQNSCSGTSLRLNEPVTRWHSSTTTRRSDNDVVTLLHVITKFVTPVELHVAAGLSAREERAVVHLEVAATIAWTQVDGIAAELGAEELAIGKLQNYCFSWLDGSRKRQRQS